MLLTGTNSPDIVIPSTVFSVVVSEVVVASSADRAGHRRNARGEGAKALPEGAARRRG